MTRIGVLGTTTWGTTLGMMLARRGFEVTLWARTDEEAAQLNRTRRHRFLPAHEFPPTMLVSADLDETFHDVAMALVVVPSVALRENVRHAAAQLAHTRIVLGATKGIEQGTGKRPSERMVEELRQPLACHVGVLSGPNLAGEIAEGKLASATVAFDDHSVAAEAQSMLTSSTFRVYTSDDVVGVELGGALKNIIAIGAGIIDGLDLGNNAKAGFITRGLAEITRLGVAMGARPETFAGLSGLGDLMATCYSGLSRNRRVGQELAQGRALPEILYDLRQTAEGVPTTEATLGLARTYGVEMPITEATARVLFEHVSPVVAMNQLMNRSPVPESDSTELSGR